MRALLLGALLLAGCPNNPDDTSETDLPVLEGPVLVHTPPATEVDAGTPLTIEVDAQDPDGVFEIKLFFRTLGDPVWDTALMEGDVDGGVWTASLSADQVEAPGLQYYFRAEDGSEFNVVSYEPEDGQQAPYLIDVHVVGELLPFVEDFEEGAGAITLFNLGWSEVSDGFSGYKWALSSTRSHGGSWSVGHRRGIDEVPALEDWLISPPLDLSSLGGDIEVTWYEWGNYTELATHSLWISTGSSDPDDGDFELVTVLEPPHEDAWGRSAVVQLSDWSDARAAYLAWYYEGQFSDDWFIDDVSVEALSADILLDGYTWDPVDPGGTTTITLTLSNAALDATGLTVTPSVDAAAGAFAGPVSAGDLANGATIDVDLELIVDPGFADNTYLPFSVEVTDGAEVWAYDGLQIVVGEPSTAFVTLTPLGPGLVQAWLGAGDPTDPDLEFPAFSQVLTATPTALEIDLTGLGAYLPPAPGADRWFLSVVANTNGSVGAFSIDHDGISYVSDDLGSYAADLDTLFFLPRAPQPVVTGVSTVPDPATPGATVAVTLSVRNDGSETVGATSVTVASLDPDAVVDTPGPFTLDADGWDEAATGQVAVDVSVAASQDDSRPVQLELVFSDDVESFVTQAEFEVPWPVLHVTGVRIDDGATGNGDGQLDAGERVDLEVDLTNVGDKASFGPVFCNLGQTGGAATLTIHDGFGAFGLLSVGDTEDETFDVEVVAGVAGDDIVLELSCTDNSPGTYTPGFELAVGEKPWVLISPIDDAPNDAIGGYEFDLVNGRYRRVGDTLQVVLTSSTPYNPGTLFVEGWMDSPGADFTWYQVVAQSGNGSLRGYQFGFTSLADPVVTAIDDYSVMIELNLPAMDLAIDQMDAGFAAGFCGGGDYYCDHFPDGWGDPYNQGLRSYLWYTMNWAD